MAAYANPGAVSITGDVGVPATPSSSIIGGALNFGGGGGSMFSGGMEGLAASYNSAYNAALSANQQNYNNILGGYQSLANTQYANQNKITQGYTDLSNRVLGEVTDSNASDLQSINDEYEALYGKSAQGLTSAGLTNSTIVNAVNRGITLDKSKAVTNSNNQYAKLLAATDSSLGLASLDYLNQANQQQVGLGTKQLDWMNSIQIPYPDASAYSQLASMYGQQAMQGQYLDMLKGLMGKTNTPQVSGGFSGVYGTQPTPNYASSGYGAYSSPMGTSPGTGLTNPYASSYGTPSSFSTYEYNPAAGAALGGYGGYDLGYYSAGGYDSTGYGGGGNF